MTFTEILGYIFFGACIGAGIMYNIRINEQIFSELRIRAPNAGFTTKPSFINNTWVAYIYDFDSELVVYQYCSTRRAHELMNSYKISEYGPAGLEHIFKSAAELRKHCNERDRR